MNNLEKMYITEGYDDKLHLCKVIVASRNGGKVDNINDIDNYYITFYDYFTNHFVSQNVMGINELNDSNVWKYIKRYSLDDLYEIDTVVDRLLIPSIWEVIKTSLILDIITKKIHDLQKEKIRIQELMDNNKINLGNELMSSLNR